MRENEWEESESRVEVAALAAGTLDGGSTDLVVMDDFIYVSHGHDSSVGAGTGNAVMLALGAGRGCGLPGSAEVALGKQKR